MRCNPINKIIYVPCESFKLDTKWKNWNENIVFFNCNKNKANWWVTKISMCEPSISISHYLFICWIFLREVDTSCLKKLICTAKFMTVWEWFPRQINANQFKRLFVCICDLVIWLILNGRNIKFAWIAEKCFCWGEKMQQFNHWYLMLNIKWLPIFFLPLWCTRVRAFFPVLHFISYVHMMNVNFFRLQTLKLSFGSWQKWDFNWCCWCCLQKTFN